MKRFAQGHVGELGQSMCTSPTAEPECLDMTPSSATCLPWGPGQVFSSLCVPTSTMQDGDENNSYSTGFVLGVK